MPFSWKIKLEKCHRIHFRAQQVATLEERENFSAAIIELQTLFAEVYE
jgi:hypothetical protein